MTAVVEALVVRKTLRVPVPPGPAGDGVAVATQFDAVLMCAGFKCSRDLLERLAALDSGAVIDLALRVLPVVRELAGDHVRHNVYFKSFPAGVPDTMAFWAQCLRDAVHAWAEGGPDADDLRGVNLLDLPAYGRYQHSYDDMLAAHAELIPAISDRMTVLHPADDLDVAAHALYLRLAQGAVPLSADDTDALRLLADHCAAMAPPVEIPVRESRAVINAVRIKVGLPPLVSTVTDVLRLACELSGGDVSLREATRFRSLPRRQRAGLLAALDGIADEAKLPDVNQYAERWKRLGYGLKPHEYPRYPRAQAVFAVARGERKAASLAGRTEAAFATANVQAAAAVLAVAPGMLWRSADRLLRSAAGDEIAMVVRRLEQTAPQVAARVLLSVREHLQNRASAAAPARIFANRRGRAWTVPDARARLDASVVADVLELIDASIMARLPEGRFVADLAIRGVALPLSGKPLPAGLGILPRGSVSRVDGDLLRFFIYWRQRERRTDYDLSALFLDEDYANPEQVSWTALRGVAAEHSGDLTSAAGPDGASEFINIRLAEVPRRFIVPQVYIYAGEGFHEVAESFFGFMTRDGEQEGQPFEARTVRMKSALYGESRIAVPLAFMRGEDGNWYAKWLHFYLRGRGAVWDHRTNQVEGARVTVSLLARSVVERDYLRVGYLLELWRRKGCEVLDVVPDDGRPVSYLGLARPEGLPEGSEAYPLSRLGDLIPALR